MSTQISGRSDVVFLDTIRAQASPRLEVRRNGHIAVTRQPVSPPPAIRTGAQPGLSIVIPAYNEEHRLPGTLDKLCRYQMAFDRDFEIVVCDDGSGDGTATLVEERAKTMPGLRLLCLPHRGKGSAVRHGMLAAKLPYVMLCDADLSMPIEQLDRFLAVLDGGCPIAVGSREMPESKRYDEPVRRHIMGRVFNWLVRLVLVPGMADTQCGFKAFHRHAARQLFSRQRSDGFSFDAEILFLARKFGFTMREVGIDWHFDDDSRVKPGSDTLKMAADLFRIRFNALRGAYRHAPALKAPGAPGYLPLESLPVSGD